MTAKSLDQNSGRSVAKLHRVCYTNLTASFVNITLPLNTLNTTSLNITRDKYWLFDLSPGYFFTMLYQRTKIPNKSCKEETNPSYPDAPGTWIRAPLGPITQGSKYFKPSPEYSSPMSIFLQKKKTSSPR